MYYQCGSRNDINNNYFSYIDAGEGDYRMIQKEMNSFDLIEHYFQMDRYEQVIEMLENNMDEHMNNEKAWYYLGYSHYSLNNFELAEKEVKEALRLGINEESAFHLLGLIYYSMEEWPESEKAFLEALRLNPNNADIHASYAYLMKSVGQNKKASRLIKKAIELDPEDGRILRLHYLIEGDEKKEKDHLDTIQTYINSNDNELNKLLHLGVTAKNRNKTKEAEEYFRQAFALDPNNEKLLNILQELEIINHPLLAISRWAHKIGMHYTWIVEIGLSILLFSLDFDTAGGALFSLYVVFCIYIWVSEPIVKLLLKRRR